MVGMWDKLDDGTWGVSVRVGGKGASMVGEVVVVRRKDKTTCNAMLTALVTDYGVGDVAIFRAESLS